MNISDYLSVTVSLVAIIVALISLFLTAKKKSERKAITVVKDQAEVIKNILKSSPSYINIMGITLKHLLFQEHLLEFIKSNPQCRLNILILDPESAAAAQLITQESRYGHKLELLSTIEELKYRARDLRNVKIRLYQDFPNTFMLVTDGLCAVQPYANPIVRKISIYRTTMLLFTPISEESKDICNSLKTNFEDMWERAAEIEIEAFNEQPVNNE